MTGPPSSTAEIESSVLADEEPRRSWVCAVCLGFALLGLFGGVAQAQLVTEFPVNGFPAGITAGPDGNLWFTGGDGPIGRITPLGVVTEFSIGISPFALADSITAGPDGNLWFTEFDGNRIGRITPLGVVTEFGTAITAGSGPSGITAGPDGNLWFTEARGNRIGRITPLGVVTEFSAGITAGVGFGITAGPDGNLWFTEGGNRIGRITPLGVVTEFSAGITAGVGSGITAGPDGNLWFTEARGNRIGRITPLGVVTEFGAGITAGVGTGDITAGPDGNLWFTESILQFSGKPFPGRIGRITPLGVVTETNAFGGQITAGPDGNLWFTAINFSTGSSIGRLTPGTAAPPEIFKSFGGATTFGLPIILNESTSLNFFIKNANAFFALTGVAFTDPLPAGLVVSTPNGLTGSCGAGTIAANAGSSTVGLTGATLAANASCFFSVNVTGSTLGTKNNVTGAVTSVEGGTGGTASASVTVVATGPPTIVKSFGAASIVLNGSTSLSFTINNPNVSTALTGVGVTDPLSPGLVVSTPNGLTGGCGAGTIVANAGSSTVSLTGATLAASASCFFSVNVTGSALGTQRNITLPVTSVEGGTGETAFASVTVAAPTTTNIPTLQPWALGLLSLLLILTASVVLRSHK